MSRPLPNWEVRISDAALFDARQAIAWSAENFGSRQARVYAATLNQALEDLAGGPNLIGARSIDNTAKGLRALHVARHGRKGRHFVVFRVAGPAKSPWIEVLRVLHDAMALAHHLPNAAEDS
jgi:toxin ParE1/3/4